MSSKNILYGGPVSLYTGKARAYLNWKGIPYEERLAGRDVYKTIIIPRVGYPIIPVVITGDDACLQDTTDIIDYFEAIDPNPSVYPDTPRQRLAALLLEVYGDEWLVLPAMHYRWNYDREWIYVEFGAMTLPDGTEEEKRKHGESIAGPFSGSLPFLGVTEKLCPAIEKSYEALLRDLNEHFSQYPYLFGSRPSIGDFGLIGPLFAHLYRDPTPGKLMREKAPLVAQWVERMQRPENPRQGEFLDDDVVPDTLFPVLRRMADEQLPVLRSTLTALGEWKNNNEGKEIPRAIGTHTFTVEGVTGERMIFPFNQWMFQRPLTYYHSLNDDQRSSVDILLSETGMPEFGKIDVPAPVRRENYQLVFAEGI